jgi:hypothetical protein
LAQPGWTVCSSPSATSNPSAQHATANHWNAVGRRLSPAPSNNNPYVSPGIIFDTAICSDHWNGFSGRWSCADVYLYSVREFNVHQRAAFSGQESHHRYCLDNIIFWTSDPQVSNDWSYIRVHHLTILTSWLQVLNRDWNGAGLIMLGTYGTATMMVNLYERSPSSRWNFLTLAIISTIHLFLSVRSASLIELPTITWQSDSCPDCQHHRRHRSISLAGHQLGIPGAGFGHRHEHGFKDVHQPFIRSRDVDVDSRESSEYQTSGFNSPRRSAETLATDARTDFGDIADRPA